MGFLRACVRALMSWMSDCGTNERHRASVLASANGITLRWCSGLCHRGSNLKQGLNLDSLQPKESKKGLVFHYFIQDSSGSPSLSHAFRDSKKNPNVLQCDGYFKFIQCVSGEITFSYNLIDAKSVEAAHVCLMQR